MKFKFKNVLILIIGFTFAFQINIWAKNSEYEIKPEQKWITHYSIIEPENIPVEQISNGVYCLLIDNQTNITKTTTYEYSRIALKVINQKGIEESARFSIDFDPSYQKLVINNINIYRTKKRISRLNRKKIKILQREKKLEYQIYDGTKSANIILDDIRVGDIIEYSYTLEGSNPIFKNKYFRNIYFRRPIPVYQIINKIIHPVKRNLFIKNYNHSNDPIVKINNGSKEYLWKFENVQALIVDNQLPEWFDPFPMIQISEMESWEEVAAWAVKIYKIKNNLSKSIIKKIKNINDKSIDDKQKLIAALRFVQDKIRYMGISIGSGAYAPGNPSHVFKRRFGDCKDKSILLIAMLNKLGIKAKPALVNTKNRAEILNYIPSPIIFDHVIVLVRIENKNYWIDPSRLFQRGNLDNLSHIDYGYALIISDGTTDLTAISSEKNRRPVRIVNEFFNISQGIEKSVEYIVHSIYSGNEADNMRYQLATTSKEKIQKKYLNFYAKYYPQISLKRNIQIRDDTSKNKIVLIEFYTIKNLFRKSEHKNQYEAKFIPLEIKDYLRKPETIKRLMPYKIEHPVHIQYKTKILLPEEINVDSDNNIIEADAFIFMNNVKCKNKIIELGYRFKTYKDHVLAEDISDYIKNIDEVINYMGFTIYKKDNQAFASFKGGEYLNWSIIFIVIIFSTVFVYFCLKLYDFKPVMNKLAGNTIERNNTPYWLFIIILIVCFGLFWQIVEFYNILPAYSLRKWLMLTSPGSEFFHALWAPILIFKLVVNISVICFSILIIVLFFKKKQNFTLIFIVFGISYLVFSLINFFSMQVIYKVNHDIFLGNYKLLIIKGVLLSILSLYAYKSKKLKKVFVKN